MCLTDVQLHDLEQVSSLLPRLCPASEEGENEEKERERDPHHKKGEMSHLLLGKGFSP